MSEKDLYDPGRESGMSPDDKSDCEQAQPFPYRTVEEYIEDVVEWLCESSWKYRREEALRCIRDHQSQVYDVYAHHVSVDMCCAEAGYYCG